MFFSLEETGNMVTLSEMQSYSIAWSHRTGSGNVYYIQVYITQRVRWFLREAWPSPNPSVLRVWPSGCPERPVKMDKVTLFHNERIDIDSRPSNNVCGVREPWQKCSFGKSTSTPRVQRGQVQKRKYVCETVQSKSFFPDLTFSF